MFFGLQADEVEIGNGFAKILRRPSVSPCAPQNKCIGTSTCQSCGVDGHGQETSNVIGHYPSPEYLKGQQRNSNHRLARLEELAGAAFIRT